ncbi:MAG: LysE family translocator [Pseudomonadota bacterium]
MSLSTYLLYLAAVALLVLSPGPTMLMCMTNSLQHGPRKALAAAAGSVTAVLGTMLLSALGLGALLAASETAFWVLKAAGAAYLIWLGIKTFRSQTTVFDEMPSNGTQTKAVVPARKLYIQGLIVGGSNPKALLFFTAFFPQFLDPTAAWAPQFAVLASTFVAFEFTVLTLCALGVARLAPVLRSGARMRWFNRISGGLFTLMGTLLLATRRAT